MNTNVCTEGYSNPWVCTQCGMCVAVCPTDALSMQQNQHGYRYPVVDDERCISCGICTEICPGPRLISQGQHCRPTATDQVYGPLSTHGIGWAKDDEVRKMSSSGGLITAVLLSLLEAGVIQGAVVTDLRAEGCLPRTMLARTREEIRGASGSKYMITSLTEGVKEIVGASDGPFAVVGLPCQIHAVRRAMNTVKPLRSKIAYCISLFCGGTKDYRYRSLIVDKMGLDEAQLVKFAFRGEGWPGEMAGEDASGQTGTLHGYDNELGRIWSNAQLTPRRCLLCDDPLGGAADLVVGDPWHIDSAQHDLGNSLFLARTEIGASMLSEAVARQSVQTEASVSISEILQSARGILWRRFYAPSRIKLVSLWAQGWRETASEVPFPSIKLLAQAARAIVLSRLR